MQTNLDWTKLGQALRAGATDAHGYLPSIEIAYAFLLDNPECFIDGDEWPAEMPTEAPRGLIDAYLGVVAP